MMRDWRTAVLSFLAGIVISGSGSAVSARDGVTSPVLPTSRGHPLEAIWSGKRFSSETARALHDAREENPANGILAEGRLLWKRSAGAKDLSCRSCHNSPAFSMRNAGTRYPRYYRPWKKMMNLEQRINRCRTVNMQAKPWPATSRSMIAAATLVRHQSWRNPVRVQVDGRAKPFFNLGELMFRERIGQSNMSCENCHQTWQGKRIGARTLSQGQSNGFPAYVLGNGKVTLLHQQFQQCNARVGAEPLPVGSDDYINLELYLAWRGQGLPIETPAVRD